MVTGHLIKNDEKDERDTGHGRRISETPVNSTKEALIYLHTTPLITRC
jgi:hypothetical protein